MVFLRVVREFAELANEAPGQGLGEAFRFAVVEESDELDVAVGAVVHARGKLNPLFVHTDDDGALGWALQRVQRRGCEAEQQMGRDLGCGADP